MEQVRVPGGWGMIEATFEGVLDYARSKVARNDYRIVVVFKKDDGQEIAIIDKVGVDAPKHLKNLINERCSACSYERYFIVRQSVFNNPAELNSFVDVQKNIFYDDVSKKAVDKLFDCVFDAKDRHGRQVLIVEEHDKKGGSRMRLLFLDEAGGELAVSGSFKMGYNIWANYQVVLEDD